MDFLELQSIISDTNSLMVCSLDLRFRRLGKGQYELSKLKPTEKNNGKKRHARHIKGSHIVKLESKQERMERMSLNKSRKRERSRTFQKLIKDINV